MGAKYSPCMRKDNNLLVALEKDRNLERQSACCARNDGSGCSQMTENRCSVSNNKTFEHQNYEEEFTRVSIDINLFVTIL